MRQEIEESGVPPGAPDASSAREDVLVHRPAVAHDRRALPRSRQLVLTVASPVVLLLVWELAAGQGVLDRRFFPAPSAVAGALLDSVAGGELFAHLAISLERILAGFAIGAVPAVVLGMAMGLSPVVRAVIQPLVDATFPIPKLAVLPLFIIIFGLGEASKYAVIAITVFYLVLLNTAAGVRHIDRTQLDVAASFGATRRLVFTDVALPGALPMILAGLKLGMNTALLIIVAVEFTGADSGIGYLIWNSWQIFKVELMYVGLVATALLGFAFAGLFALAERLLVPWKR